jgi:signal transduction histidine kinase
MTKWLLGDLHIHSNFSDGLLSIEEIVEIYGKSGFDVIAITDHLFDTESQRSLELHEEGKSIKNIGAYFGKIRVAKLIQKQKTVSQLREKIDSLGSLAEKKESNLRTLAHDLKSPLISMGFSARRMLRRSQNEEMTGALKTIYDSSLHLTRWVDETLSSKDLASSGLQEQMKEVDIKSLVRQAIDLLKESCLEKSIQIQFKIYPSIPLISCHEPLMYRALVNLLSNALKYTPRGGEIEVSIHAYFNKKGSGVLEISFRDTGIGICEEDKEKIFQPYYRGRNASSEEGRGLGLSFVKEVIDLHGGKILVQSEPNVGSIFSILLPVQNAPKEENRKIYEEVSSLSDH